MKKGGKPIQIINRSLKQTWMRFMIEINFNICPRDSVGPGICKHHYLIMKEMSREFLQPGFEVYLNVIKYEPGVNTNMHCKFINGFEHRLQGEVTVVIRALEGQDDEPDDGF